jgi:hypothetical protein
LLAHGRRFSPGTPASSTTYTGRHDIAEILLKVALNTKNQIKSIIYLIQNVIVRIMAKIYINLDLVHIILALSKNIIKNKNKKQKQTDIGPIKETTNYYFNLKRRHLVRTSRC